MNEIGQSIAEAIRKRAASSTLGTYLFFWSVLHWEGIYTTLFTSQELIFDKYNVLKNEYVGQYFFGWHGWSTVIAYVLPIALTVLFIWIIPRYILLHAYRQEQRHKVDKWRVRYEEEERLEEARKDLAIQQKQAAEAEVDASQAIRKASKTDPSILWEREMTEFLKIEKAISTLSALKVTIYEDNGHLTGYESYGDWIDASGIPVDELALADTNDLITFDKSNQTIELTKKGKFFLSRFSAAPQSVEA